MIRQALTWSMRIPNWRKPVAVFPCIICEYFEHLVQQIYTHGVGDVRHSASGRGCIGLDAESLVAGRKIR